MFGGKLFISISHININKVFWFHNAVIKCLFDLHLGQDEEANSNVRE